MVWTTSSVEGVLTDFPTPILPKIGGEPTREVLIDLHQFISGKLVYVASNPGEGRNGRLALTMISKEYMAQTVYVFVPPPNSGNYLPTMRTTQEQVLIT